MSKGRHRSTGKPDQSGSKPKKNTSDPQTCAHIGHSKTKVPVTEVRGGYDRKCGSCCTEWWTPS